MTNIPDWMEKYIQEARGLYGVGGPDWHFSAEIKDKLKGHPTAAAFTETNFVYKNVNMYFLSDCEDDNKSRENCHHEVLHVAHVELDQIVDSIIAQLPKGKKKYFRQIYDDADERFVQTLARCICHHVVPKE